MVAEKSLRQQNFLHCVNRQRRLLSELVVDSHHDDAGGHVDLVCLAGEVQPPVAGECPDWVTDGLEVRQGVELDRNQIEIKNQEKPN